MCFLFSPRIALVSSGKVPVLFTWLVILPQSHFVLKKLLCKVYSKQWFYFLQIIVYVSPAFVGKSYSNVGLRLRTLRFAFGEINGSLTLTVAKNGFGFSPLACFSAFPLTKTTALGTRKRQCPPKCDVMLIFWT